jgi:hypothetical protein
VVPRGTRNVGGPGGTSEPHSPPDSSVAVTRGTSGVDSVGGTHNGDGGPEGASASRGPGRSECPKARAVAPHVRTIVMAPSGGRAKRGRFRQRWPHEARVALTATASRKA